MKLRLTLFALLISVGSMAQKIPAIKSKETIKHTFIEYVDGVKFELIGSDTKKRRDSAYLANYVAPKPTKPTFTPPSGSYINYTIENGKQINLSDIVKTSKLVRFKTGNYKGVFLYSNSTLNDVVFDFTGVVCDDCTIDLGAGNNVKIYGLETVNNPGRAIKFNFGLNGFELYNFKFTNCNKDYSISLEQTKAFPIVNTGFKLINCTFDNSGAVALFGERDGDKDNGVFKGAEIAYNTFKNSSSGKVVEIGNACNYDIHDNIGKDLNANNNNHNGLFELQGNGKFYNNNFQNYQGNSIRAWLFSRDGNGVDIYNNICYSTRKYGAFEIQEFARHITKGKTTIANAKVYNNTVGKMNTSKDWEGQILDLYNISGSLEYKNNLGFELNRVSGQITNMVNYNGNSKPELNYELSLKENKYFANWQDAVENLTNFKSKINGIGAVQ